MYADKSTRERVRAEHIRRLTDPTVTEQIAAILQVKPDGPLGRRILRRVRELGY